MVAGIEVYEQMQAFASLREPGWHGLGTVFQEEVTTSQMLDLAYLSDWDVRTVPLDEVLPEEYRVTNGETIIVRTSPFDGGVDVLGQAKGRYTAYQNEDAFSFGDTLLDGGGTWETAGSIRGGRTVFGSLSFERTMLLDPQGAGDLTRLYMLVATSHDGTMPVTAFPTSVRVVCQNTFTLALRSGSKANAGNMYKFRHTANAGNKIEEARKALGVTFTYMDEFEREAQTLFETNVTDQEFWKIVEAVYPTPDADAAKSAVTRHDNLRETIAGYWNGVTTANIQNTAWGALNALTERLDWGRKPRNGSAENAFINAAGFDTNTNAEKQRIFDTVKAFANV